MRIFNFFKKKEKSVNKKQNKEYIFNNFNFEKYPNLLPLYDKYHKLGLQVVKYSMKDTNQSADNMIKIKKEKDEFARTVFAEAIYEVFNKEKPLIYNVDEKYSIKWDEHFNNKSFSELDNDLRDDLVGLIDRNFIYELPKKYYKKK